VGVGADGRPTTTSKRLTSEPRSYTSTVRRATSTTIAQCVQAAFVPGALIQPAWPFGRPGRRTCSHNTPCGPRYLPSTGSLVCSCVSGVIGETTCSCAAVGAGLLNATCGVRTTASRCVGATRTTPAPAGPAWAATARAAIAGMRIRVRIDRRLSEVLVRRGASVPCLVAVPFYICPKCKERSLDIDAREGFSSQAPACRHCGFGFLFELLDDYYPAPDTGMLVTDQERRVLAIGRGVFELTGFPESDLMGRDVVEALTFSDEKPVELAREWGVRRLGERISIRTRAGNEKAVVADVFPAYDDDGGLLVALTPRRG